MINCEVQKFKSSGVRTFVLCLIPYVLRLLLLVTGYSLLATPLSFASTSLGAFRMGDELRGNSARSLAMGGTAIASSNDSTALFTNPAVLSQMKSGNEISVSPGFATVFYRRTHPDAKFTSDSNTLFNLQSFSASARLPKFSFLTVAVGWNAASNFDFDFEEESTRDRHDQENSGIMSGVDKIKMRGNLAQWSAGVSVKPFQWISFGGAYLRPGGRIKSETTFLTVKTGQSPVTQKLEWTNEFSGAAFLAGMAVHISPTLILGSFYQPGFDLEISSTSNFIQGSTLRNSAKSDSVFQFPDRYGAGVLYGFGGSEKNLISADLIYSRWETCRRTMNVLNNVSTHTHTNPYFRNTIEFHLGYEYWIKDKFPLRLGFYYVPDYVRSPESATSFFTAGTGYEWKDFTVDLAGEFGRRTISQDQFFASNQRDEVVDTRFRFLATISYKLR